MIEYDVDPLSLAVLFAIKNGVKDPSKIARELNVDERSILEVIKELEEKGLIKNTKKKILFFEINDLRLTRDGYDTLIAALDKLKPKLEEVREVALSRGPEEAAALMNTIGLGMLVPFLLPLLLSGLFIGFLPDDTHNNIHPHTPF